MTDDKFIKKLMQLEFVNTLRNKTGIQGWLQWGMLLYLFLLPWQARYLFADYSFQTPFYGGLSLYATDLLFVVLFVGWFVFTRQTILAFLKQHRFIFLLSAGLVSFSFLSAWWSPEPLLSLISSLRVLQAVSLVLMILTIEVETRAILLTLILSAVVQSFFALQQFLFQEISPNTWLGIAAQDPRELGVSVIEYADQRWLRAYGILPHPNILGAFLSLGLIAASGWFVSVYRRLFIEAQPFYRELRFEIVGSLSAFIFSLLGLLFTFSRTAWLGGGIGFLTLMLYSLKGQKLRTVALPAIKLILVSAVLFLFLQTAVGPLWTQRFSGESRLAQVSSTERADLTASAEKLIKEHPFRGVGVGQYVKTMQDRFSGQAVYAYQPVHNTWLLAWAELGVVGVIFFALAVAVLYRFVMLFKKQRAFRIESAIVVALFVSAFIMLYFEHFWWSLTFGLLLTAVVVGLMLRTTLTFSKQVHRE